MMIKNVSDIDTRTMEGRLLIVTFGRLSSQPNYSSKHPDVILQEMIKVADEIYKEK